MRLLLVLANVHSLARQPVLALPYALSAWLQANELHLDVMVLPCFSPVCTHKYHQAQICPAVHTTPELP